MKSIITVTCPECGGLLEIDVSRQKVLSHKVKIDGEATPEDKAKLFDEVVNRVKRKKDESEQLFDRLKKDVADSEKRLDDLFGEVKKKIKETRDDPDAGEDPRKLFWD
jgi:uncharacterized Zn finger protein (UPF0148 family)